MKIWYGATDGFGTATPAEIVPVIDPLLMSAWWDRPSMTVKVPLVDTDPPIFALDWNRTLPTAATDPSTCGVESITTVPPE
ncbi:hypothetical protein E3O42_04140 [Cryobacterium adonitolivorans]|uniref:Uncharacterized protein n=1 Tax=Cryobacterium adonitolivorans TaxID=1259189 RepID=A0A4R8WEF2_9MICO|nr:hypothetical protein [Cryobacterium adonitolivorans]TFC05052.1 hypothetical protein E3O42_04140 [Cryobacterium adonitolivorans]